MFFGKHKSQVIVVVPPFLKGQLYIHLPRFTHCICVLKTRHYLVSNQIYTVYVLEYSSWIERVKDARDLSASFSPGKIL